MSYAFMGFIGVFFFLLTCLRVWPFKFPSADSSLMYGLKQVCGNDILYSSTTPEMFQLRDLFRCYVCYLDRYRSTACVVCHIFWLFLYVAVLVGMYGCMFCVFTTRQIANLYPDRVCVLTWRAMWVLVEFLKPWLRMPILNFQRRLH